MHRRYMEDAYKKLKTKFDIVFNRVCWYYGVSDHAMGNVIKKLVQPGGYAFIETNNTASGKKSVKRSIQNFCNNYFYLKIGHPYPPSGRIEKLFRKELFTIVHTDYSNQEFDKVIVKKCL